MEGFKPPREDLNSPDLYIPGKQKVEKYPSNFEKLTRQSCFLNSYGSSDICFALWFDCWSS
jgi:hypothetical protein